LLINVYGVDCFPGGPMTGICTEGTPACSYCALPVLCTPTYGPRSFYACVCSGGSWSCSLVSQDGSVCIPADAAAADAAADSALDATDAEGPWVGPIIDGVR
jgi:hypothetical protein